MAKYYVLVKRRGAKKYSLAMPSKPGVSLGKLKRVVRKTINRAYTYKVVSAKVMKAYLKKNLKEAMKRRRGRKVRRVKRHRRRR